MPYHPYYDNGGTHWGLWIVIIVAMLVFFAILAWAVVSIIRQRDGHSGGGVRDRLAPAVLTPFGSSMTFRPWGDRC